jgi:hypothetical protein
MLLFTSYQDRQRRFISTEEKEGQIVGSKS